MSHPVMPRWPLWLLASTLLLLLGLAALYWIDPSLLALLAELRDEAS
ncbi:MAG: hypothetical protein WBG38_20680 [Nodosilinea sp.]